MMEKNDISIVLGSKNRKHLIKARLIVLELMALKEKLRLL